MLLTSSDTNLITQEVMEIENYQYTMKDIIRPYSEILASLFSTPKKSKANLFDEDSFNL